jgi:hypothetical protein
MINFNEFQNKKKIEQLREDILKIGSSLPFDTLDEAFNVFLENSPFQQSNWWGNLKSGLKAGWDAWKDQSTQSNQNNPVGQNYKALSSSLDGFLNALKAHPVAQRDTQFINSLSSFKQELSAQAERLAQQMSQQNQPQPQQNQPQPQPQQGQGQPNINQLLGMK